MKSATIAILFLLSIPAFSQFDIRQERRIRLEEDSLREKEGNNSLFEMFERKHYEFLLGIHQGKRTEFELGVHHTNRKVNGIWATSVSYIRNYEDKINSIAVSAWAGAFLGAGLILKTNTTDFKSFSYSIQPLVGFEYYYAGIYYGPNINIDSYKTPTLNVHTVTLRIHFAVITKKGRRIDKW